MINMSKILAPNILASAILLLTACNNGGSGVYYYKGQLVGSSWDRQAQLMECIYNISGQNAFGTFQGYLPRGQTLCPRYAKWYSDNTMDFIYPN